MTIPVMKWQETLAGRGLYAGKIDGDFGPLTYRASMDALGAGDVTPEPDKKAMAEWIPYPKPTNTIGIPDIKHARKIDTLIWHCAATPEGKDYKVADIRSWHRARGWSDIGYHFVVYRDGSIHAGRPLNQIGAHTEGHNEGSVGCCYIGGMTSDMRRPKDTRTPEQRDAMLWLTRELARIYTLQHIRGHNDFTSAKACPSFRVRTDALGNIPGFERGDRI